MSKLSGISNVVDFGKRAAKLKGRRARQAYNSDFTNAIPGARDYAQFYDADTLAASTYPDPSGDLVTATMPTDLTKRFFDMGEWDEVGLENVDFNARALAKPGEDEFTVFDDLPTVDISWDRNTGDITMAVGGEALADLEAVRRAGIARGAKEGELPFYMRWTGDRPWDVDKDWKHSGTIKVVDDDTGATLGSYRDDDFHMPFDTDFIARRDQEKAAQWWSKASHFTWAQSREATIKRQATTSREAEEMLRGMYSPEAEEWFKRTHSVGERSILGRNLVAHALDNGIDISPRVQNTLQYGDANMINEFLSGGIDPRINAEEALADTKFSDLMDGTWRKNWEERQEVAKGNNFPAGGQETHEYFQGVMAKMREEDPARYQQMLDYVKDSPYRSGVVHPGVAGDPEAPVVIFHSGRHLKLDEMGYPELELGTFDPSTSEVGTHAGDLEQSAPFAGYEVRTHADTGIGGRPQVNTVARRSEIVETLDNLKTTLGEEAGARLEKRLFAWLNENASMMRTGQGASGYWDRPLQFSTNEMDALLEGVTFKSQDLYWEAANNIRSLADRLWFEAGQVTYPMVFRGKRPFRFRDVNHNDAWSLADDALTQYDGWTPSSREKLEMIVNDPGAGAINDAQANVLFRSALEDSGFDHIVYTNSAEGTGRPSIIFWDQSLAKPLYGSRGFDKNSDNWARAVLGAPGLSIFTQEEE
jgi:hypothetical protein